LEKAIQYYVTRYLTAWELDVIQPPGLTGRTGNTAGPRNRRQQAVIAAARDKADFLFSLLPLTPLKSGYHPAPGSCLWIYALVVQDYLRNQNFNAEVQYELYYRQLGGHQQQTEYSDFINLLRSFSERQIEQLIHTGPAPYWISKPLFPALPTSSVTKETCAPAKIWKLNSLQPSISRTNQQLPSQPAR
jgi:hypothetical protein